MKASPTSILYSAIAFLALTACQSNTYKIQGSVSGMEDGDTLYITSDMQTGIPSDTLVVKDGKFTFESETDSVYLAMVYYAARNEINAPFFVEPGTITISLSETVGMSRVGGTKCNNEWQKLNDSVMAIGKEINHIAEHIYGNTVSEEEQKKGMEKIDKLNKRFSDIVVNAAEENIDNEFGYFLLVYYPEEVINNATRARLIEKLPDAMKQRPGIQDIKKSIEASAKTSEGSTINDFSQATPEGSQLSIMEEIRKNKVTIIDFWASWCGPCRQEMPIMVEMYDKFKDSGLGIVGISLDQDKDDWMMAIDRLGIKWPQMSDLKGWDNAAAQQFNITGIPHTIVVDNTGKILRRGLRGEALQEYIAEYLK